MENVGRILAIIEMNSVPHRKLPHTSTLSVYKGSDKNMTNAQMHEILMREPHTHTHTHKIT